MKLLLQILLLLIAWFTELTARDIRSVKIGAKVLDVTATGILKSKEELIKMTGKVVSSIGKFTLKQIDEWVVFATKQNSKSKVMLGMWDGGGANSYISKAGSNYTYFDFGSKWNEVSNIVNGNADEIWKINKEFIDRQKLANKEFWFSHDPFTPVNSQFFAREINYMIDLGVKDFQKIGNIWKAIW